MRAFATSERYLSEYCDVGQELGRFGAVERTTVRECLGRYPSDAPTVFGYGLLETLAWADRPDALARTSPVLANASG